MADLNSYGYVLGKIHNPDIERLYIAPNDSIHNDKDGDSEGNTDRTSKEGKRRGSSQSSFRRLGRAKKNLMAWRLKSLQYPKSILEERINVEKHRRYIQQAQCRRKNVVHSIIRKAQKEFGSKGEWAGRDELMIISRQYDGKNRKFEMIFYHAIPLPATKHEHGIVRRLQENRIVNIPAYDPNLADLFIESTYSSLWDSAKPLIDRITEQTKLIGWIRFSIACTNL